MSCLPFVKYPKEAWAPNTFAVNKHQVKPKEIECTILNILEQYETRYIRKINLWETKYWIYHDQCEETCFEVKFWTRPHKNIRNYYVELILYNGNRKEFAKLCHYVKQKHKLGNPKQNDTLTQIFPTNTKMKQNDLQEPTTTQHKQVLAIFLSYVCTSNYKALKEGWLGIARLSKADFDPGHLKEKVLFEINRVCHLNIPNSILQYVLVSIRNFLPKMTASDVDKLNPFWIYLEKKKTSELRHPRVADLLKSLFTELELNFTKIDRENIKSIEHQNNK